MYDFHWEKFKGVLFHLQSFAIFRILKLDYGKDREIAKFPAGALSSFYVLIFSLFLHFLVNTKDKMKQY